jgi:hypothetical protein
MRYGRRNWGSHESWRTSITQEFWSLGFCWKRICCFV